MTVAARLRALEAEATVAPWSGVGPPCNHEALWPLLADLAEAAENARPPHTHPHTSTQIPCRACALDAALARVADQLNHEAEGSVAADPSNAETPVPSAIEGRGQSDAEQHTP